MTQPAIIPALLQLYCLLLSLPGVMRETDLAKSLPAARCEMDSGTGRHSPAGICWASRSPASLPVRPSQGQHSSPTSTSTAGSPRQQPQGIWALRGRKFSAQPEGHVIAAQPFIRFILPQQPQTSQELPACLPSFATTNP